MVSSEIPLRVRQGDEGSSDGRLFELHLSSEFSYLREQATWHFPIAERNHEQRPALPDDGAPLTTRARG